MVFSSITFLFFFLPAVVGLYYLSPRPLRNTLLLVASLLFYTWGTGALVIALLGSIAANYVLGLLVQRAVSVGRRDRARWLLAVAVVLNIGLLGWFKYANFAVDQANAVLAGLGASSVAWTDILLPVGVSFYTFHSLSYLIDLYRGVARHLTNPLDFALYITFFPQLVAGPIVRFHEIRDQLVGRAETSHAFARGVYRFAHGLGKKVLIADTIAPVANAAFATSPSELSTVAALVGIVAYTVQLYFDFSGYSDMAIGLGQMFGFRLPENFDRPYASRSVTEFWRRWHQSLSRWFRDYLYIPLGGNRGPGRRTYVNLILVFLATGIWHGANWTFVAWGAWHGALLLIERWRGVGRDATATAPDHLGRARTIVLVVLGWVLFRSPDLGHAIGYLGAFARPGVALPDTMTLALGPVPAIALALGLGSFFLPASWVTGRRLERDGARGVGALRVAALGVVLPLALVLLVAGNFSPFLYFQF